MWYTETIGLTTNGGAFIIPNRGRAALDTGLMPLQPADIIFSHRVEWSVGGPIAIEWHKLQMAIRMRKGTIIDEVWSAKDGRQERGFVCASEALCHRRQRICGAAFLRPAAG